MKLEAYALLELTKFSWVGVGAITDGMGVAGGLRSSVMQRRDASRFKQKG